MVSRRDHILHEKVKLETEVRFVAHWYQGWEWGVTASGYEDYWMIKGMF
jgi:hypothetical protein